MSGADCNNGCTDCPTCRGEVRPDAPAMHDMNFAMAMQKGAFADRRWGSMAVAQTVREGIRRRGGQSADDQRMLEFVEAVQREAVAHEAAGPWGSPGFSFDDASQKLLLRPSPMRFDQEYGEVMLDTGLHGLPWNRPFTLSALDDRPPVLPNQPHAPQVAPSPDDPPPIEAPLAKPSEPTTPGTLTVAPVTEDWLKVIKGLPDLPSQSSSSTTAGGPICGVKRFDYPIVKSFSGLPPNGTQRPKNPPGFHFKAALEYFPDNPFACECCVFRQWYRKQGWSGYRRDRNNAGREYGGARPDGSTKDTPDDSKKESVATDLNTPCKLEFSDSPGEGGHPGEGSWKLTYDFIGVVFDRCQNWVPVAVRRMLMLRDVKYVYHGADEKAILIVQDAEGSPKLEAEKGPP